LAYRLGEAARAAGHRLHVHDRLGSTNTEALERARAGETGPLWVVAHRQEAGRGRRGNRWSSLPGWDGADPARSVRLNWPNDVLMAGAKLAGLLLEAETLPGGRRAVVIGFGVNVAAAPEDLPTGGLGATSLAAAGYVGGPEALLEHLSDHLAAQARIWNGGANFARIRALWLARAAGLGSEIAVASGERVLRGRFDTIDEGGRLVILGPENARHVVTAGDVHFGTAATAA
jgi:BirA family biotin operon repressor/biotin-[acetyl-CoA-carboxylase] ligase